jgi:nicotinamidase-related amidase
MQALIIVDMQRWMFRHPERAAQLPAIVPTINRLAASFAANEWPIFSIGVVHTADRSTWTRLMLKSGQPCLIEGTADVEPVDGLFVPLSARAMSKRSNSAFFGTDLEAQLRALNVATLVLTGAFIDGCVGLTAADAAQRGFEVIIVEDGICHCDRRHGTTLIEWLVAMYQLRIEKSAAIHGPL